METLFQISFNIHDILLVTSIVNTCKTTDWKGKKQNGRNALTRRNYLLEELKISELGSTKVEFKTWFRDLFSSEFNPVVSFAYIGPFNFTLA